MDRMSANKRSEIMRSVRSKDTRPELVVRKLVFSLGYRYRLHSATLPGKPDIVFASRKKVIFVHGCFWHRHRKCKYASLPASRQDYWIPKFQNTKARDERNQHELIQRGWAFLIVWECELRKQHMLVSKIQEFLEDDDKTLC